MRRDGRLVEEIGDLAGLSKSHPMMALALMIFMFSMAGIPPLAGFFGKWYVFMAAVDAGLFGLAIIGILTSVVAAFYYLGSSRSCTSTTAPSRWMRVSQAISV